MCKFLSSSKMDSHNYYEDLRYMTIPDREYIAWNSAKSEVSCF